MQVYKCKFTLTSYYLLAERCYLWIKMISFVIHKCKIKKWNKPFCYKYRDLNAHL